MNDEVRARLREVLPDALTKTMDSYHAFIDGECDEKAAKNFSAHHAAGKAAIAHLEALLKLASSIGMSKGDDDGSQKIKALIEDAQREICDYRKRQEISKK